MELFLSFVIPLCIGIVGGYILALYTWPWLRAKWNGAMTEAALLRQRALELETKAKGLFGK